jgi:hypothetical protein
MPGKKMLSRGYTAVIALLCTASVAYAIHANRQAADADHAGAKAREWERYARATLAHRTKTTKSLRLLVQQYNALTRRATADQRRLLANLAQARRRAARAQPATAPTPVVYETTKTLALPQPAVQLASAAPATPSEPMTKTS